MAEPQSLLSEFQQDLDDQLTCSVCLDQYTNPKTLSCHHSFCLDCVKPLPIEIKDKLRCIYCPTCREIHQLPEGGVNNLPNAFHINSLLGLQKKLTIRKCAKMTCPKHNDPMKVYCVTCCQVICRDCTFSETHNKHQFELISECYPKHHQQIQADLDLLRHKSADINTSVTDLVTAEREVVEQGEEVKKEIRIHAQQLIDQVQRLEQQLLQEVDTAIQQKKQLLTKQREQAESVHVQLKTCEEMVERSLKEWSQQQVMMEKQRMLDQMKTVSQHVEPIVYQPIEKANTKFTKIYISEEGIGEMTDERYGEATITLSPCSPNTPSTAILTIQSCDSSPFSLPPSLISCKLSSSGDSQLIKCEINQIQQGKYNISFIPCSRGDQLMVQVGGVDISGSPFILPVIPSSVGRGKPVNSITGLNRPYGIAVCDNGDIVVAECGAHCITIVNKNGKKMRSFGTKGKEEGQFTYPQGLAISNDGDILVTENHRVQKLTFDGVCVKSIGSSKEGSSQLQLHTPRGIAVHPTTGQIFVADSGNDRIQVFNNDLTFSHTITLPGDKMFMCPFDVSLDSEECLYVAEWGNHCITKLTTTGQYMARLGSAGSAPGRLFWPSSLTINSCLVYISEGGCHRVSIFDTEGTHLHCFGERGSGEGEFDCPLFIASDKLGSLYISDYRNNRIVMFQ